LPPRDIIPRFFVVDERDEVDRALELRADILDFFAILAVPRFFAVLLPFEACDEPREREADELRELPLRDLAAERLDWAIRFERALEVAARPLVLVFVLFLAEEADFERDCFLAPVDVGISINLLKS
jgi:hypothetical protein